MKIFLINLFFIGAILLSSCKKEISKSTNTPANPNSFTLKKDGVSYSPNYIFVSQVDEDALAVETYMVYQQAENNTYGLFVKRSIVPGTYVSEAGGSEYFSMIHIQDSSNYFGWENSTLTVLSNDTVTKVLHCTFEVLLYNDDCDGSCPQITDGEMTIHY
ncbi:hypothetical protein [Fluviicola taffensis]|uniref:hypothetical protein n=1 Tax=Fluviicola taffensis TaxID=191579 RepID=UPI003138372F